MKTIERLRPPDYALLRSTSTMDTMMTMMTGRLVYYMESPDGLNSWSSFPS